MPPVETPQELAGFFSPVEFGSTVVAELADGDFAFDAILTETHEEQNPGFSAAAINSSVPRLICSWADASRIPQGTTIRIPPGAFAAMPAGGDEVVWDVKQREALATIHFKRY